MRIWLIFMIVLIFKSNIKRLIDIFFKASQPVKGNFMLRSQRIIFTVRSNRYFLSLFLKILFFTRTSWIQLILFAHGPIKYKSVFFCLFFLRMVEWNNFFFFAHSPIQCKSFYAQVLSNNFFFCPRSYQREIPFLQMFLSKINHFFFFFAQGPIEEKSFFSVHGPI